MPQFLQTKNILKNEIVTITHETPDGQYKLVFCLKNTDMLTSFFCDFLEKGRFVFIAIPINNGAHACSRQYGVFQGEKRGQKAVLVVFGNVIYAHKIIHCIIPSHYKNAHTAYILLKTLRSFYCNTIGLK